MASDLEKPVEVLVGELDVLSREYTSEGNPKANAYAVISAMKKFACVLTVLSRKADEQTSRIVKLTWGLFWITLFLALIAAGQIAIMIAAWQKEQSRPFARYEMTTGANGAVVVRLDRITGMLHYSTPHWAGDVQENWRTTPTPAPTAANMFNDLIPSPTVSPNR